LASTGQAKLKQPIAFKKQPNAIFYQLRGVHFGGWRQAVVVPAPDFLLQ
jgi:hypothetical protein